MNDKRTEFENRILNKFVGLLAAENITVVVQRGLQTAAFNPVTRVMSVPEWDCPYDMDLFLRCHECSHAIWSPTGSPAEIVQTYIDSHFEDPKSVDSEVFARVVNMCEDARIERLCLLKFAGFTRIFESAHQYLLDEGFYGVTEIPDFADRSLADRLNISVRLKVPSTLLFMDTELSHYDEMLAARTFEDVLTVAEKIMRDMMEPPEDQEEEPEDGESDESDESDADDDSGEGGAGNSSDGDQDSKDGTPEEDNEGDEGGKGDKGDGDQDSDEGTPEDGDEGEGDQDSKDGTPKEGDSKETQKPSKPINVSCDTVSSYNEAIKGIETMPKSSESDGVLLDQLSYNSSFFMEAFQ